MPQLILDTRERALIEELQGSGTSMQTETLDVGDIAIKCGNEFALVIERKTVADLVSSICDGRYREQKQRLKVLQANGTKIAYLIEGRFALDDAANLNTRSSISNSTLVSSITNMCLRDGFFIFNTSNVKESCAFIKALIKRYEQDPDKYCNSDTTNAYVPSVVKTRKKDNNTGENCFTIQLCAIPGISVKKANAIINGLNVHNMKEFVAILTSPKVLLQVEGIGKQLSETIYTYISGNE